MKLSELYDMYLNGKINLKTDLVEVSSPDGFVRIIDIIDRGIQPVYRFFIKDSIIYIDCTLNHKIETTRGWVTASDLSEAGLLTKEFISNQKTIDIEVEHENHRFYCNGISVHNSQKGLEHKHVICSGFTYKSQKMAKPTTEELNIMYVAFSRAVESLLVVHSDIITYMGEEIKGHKQKWLKKLLQDLEN